MTIADSRVVAWLVLDSHGVPTGADQHEVVVAQHASIVGGSYVTLVRESLLAEAESRISDLQILREVDDEIVRSVQKDIAALQSRLDAVGRLADRWDQFAHGMRYNPAAMPFTAEQIEHCANELRAALGGES